MQVNTGAKAAFKGFRTQTLYILERILNSNSEYVFYPEGAEDLLIKSKSGEIIEVIQIKNYTSNLSLSNLEPEKEDSFFKRSIKDYYEQNIEPKIVLISFGPLGRELKELMNSKDCQSIREKLISKKYSYKEISWIFKSLSISKVNEEKLMLSTASYLSKSITGFSSSIAFDLLMYWLYLVSENRGFVDKVTLIDKLQSIGLFFSKRKSFLTEFGTTVIPLERLNTKNRERLAEEFYQGASTRFEHIVEGFDVIRKKKILELQSLFQFSDVVIIQGASGQGKSTLAYRFLHSYVPENHSFSIHRNFSISQITQIQASLKLLVEEYDQPIFILIDVPPNDFGKWTELTKSLVEIDNLKLLVTIRAEDYNRSENIGEFVKVGDLLLDFSKSEAKEIYNSMSIIKPDFKFTHFEEAWVNYGEKGSLLEFIYLITQGESLEIRLKNQINRIVKRRSAEEVYILKVIAISHGFECEVDSSRLKSILAFNSLKNFIEELENEYLLRASSDYLFLLGLHPIRSRIISDLLISEVFDDLESIARDSLRVVSEKDLGKLLLNLFHENYELKSFLNDLGSYNISCWGTAEDILRALFWFGIKKFSSMNGALINEFEKEYHSIMFLMIDDMGMDLSGLKKINENRITKMEGEINQLVGKDLVYSYGKEWLLSLSTPSFLDMDDKDWGGIAYTLYWMNRLKVEKELDFSAIQTSRSLNEVSLNTFSNVLLSFFNFNEQSKLIYNEQIPNFIFRIKKEYNIVSLTEEGEALNVDYIYEIENHQEEKNKLTVHETSIAIIELLRKAIPDKETYGVQGFGHRGSILNTPHDDSKKNLPRKRLPLTWRTEINGIFHQYIQYQNRPLDWQEYTQAVIKTRKRSLNLLTSLNDLLEIYFKKRDFTLLKPFFNNYKSEWYNKELSKPKLLPKIALDKWGYSKENVGNNSENIQDPSIGVLSQSKKQFLLGFGEYLKATTDFFTSLSNFYNQIDRVYLYNLYTHNKTGKDLEKAKRFLKENGYSHQILRLSIINLFKAFQELPKFQNQFDKHFSKFYSSGLLTSLKEDESKCYLSASITWKKFSQLSPSSKFKKEPKNPVENSFSKLKNDIELNLDKNLTLLCNKKVIETYDIVQLEDQGTKKFAILFDVDSPIDIFLSFQHVLRAIEKSFSPASYTSVKRLIIDKYFSPIIILPLVFNRIVLPIYYDVPAFEFLNSDRELTLEAIGMYGKKISNLTLSRLKVGQWEDEIPNLKNARNLLENSTNMLAYLSHLAQIEGLIEKLDDENSEGLKVIIDHSKPKLIAIVNLLQQTYKEIDLISSDIPLTTEDMSGDANRQEFAQIYMGLLKNIIEFSALFGLDNVEGDEDSFVTADINSKDIVRWNSIFQEEIQEQTFLVYLYWAGELIKKTL